MTLTTEATTVERPTLADGDLVSVTIQGYVHDPSPYTFSLRDEPAGGGWLAASIVCRADYTVTVLEKAVPQPPLVYHEPQIVKAKLNGETYSLGKAGYLVHGVFVPYDDQADADSFTSEHYELVPA